MSGGAYAGRRPGPRRVGRRVRPSRVRWDRVGRVALVLVLFGVMASYLNPVVNLVDAWRDSRVGEERLAGLKAENAGLRERVADARDPATLEREARKVGALGGSGRLRQQQRGGDAQHGPSRGGT